MISSPHHSGLSFTLKHKLLFPRGLWVNLRRDEKGADGGLRADVWSGHCVCRKVRGQKKFSEVLIGQSGPCPLAELSHCLDGAGSDQHSHSGDPRLAQFSSQRLNTTKTRGRIDSSVEK